MFEYDHSLLSIIALQQKGIRSVRELEEVIEGYSFADEDFRKELGYPIIYFIGFTNASRPLKIACRLNLDNRRLITLGVHIPTVEEIIADFCIHC